MAGDLPLKVRITGRAYDFVVMGIGVWFLMARGGWIPWTCFIVANLAGLFLFDNRLSRRSTPLTRPWFAPLTFYGIGALTLSPFLLVLDDPGKLRGVVATVIFVGIRFLFPRRPRR